MWRSGRRCWCGRTRSIGCTSCARVSDRARARRERWRIRRFFWRDVDALPANVIDNLRWLVPLALDRDVAMPIEVRSAAAEGSGLTERDRERE